jgi:hypothetical protein
MTKVDLLALAGTAVSVFLMLLMVAIAWYDRITAANLFRNAQQHSRHRKAH